MFTADGLIVEGTRGQVLAGGTPEERSSDPFERETRVNTVTGKLEMWLNGAWNNVGDRELTLKGSVTSTLPTVLGALYPFDTSAGSFNVPFPSAPSTGDVFAGFDEKGTWNINPITLVKNGTDKIEGDLTTVLKNVENGYFKYIYSGETQGWIDVNKIEKPQGVIYTWVAITSSTSVTAQPNTGYYVYTDGAGGPTTIQLPASPTFGDVIRVVDRQGSAGVSPINILRNGKKIQNIDSDVVINEAFQAKDFSYFGSDGTNDSWVITADNSGGGSITSLNDSDLNVIGDGRYYQDTAADGTLANHYPMPSFVGFIEQHNDYQEAMSSDSGRRYTRHKDSGTWTVWVPVLDVPLNPTTIVGANNATVSNKKYAVDTSVSGSAFFPSSPSIGDEVWFIDVTANASINSFEIKQAATSEKIVGGNGPYILNVNRQVCGFTYSPIAAQGWIEINSSGGGGGIAFSSTYVSTEGTVTGLSGTAYFGDTSGGAADLTLPANPTAGSTIGVVDVKGTFGSNAFTIKRNASGERIMGAEDDLLLPNSNQAIFLIYSGDSTQGWRIAYGTHLGGAGGGNSAFSKADAWFANVLTTEDLDDLNDGVKRQAVALLGTTARNYPYAGFIGTVISSSRFQMAIGDNGSIHTRVYTSEWQDWLKSTDLQIENATSSGSHQPDFSGMVKAYSTTITEDVTILSPTVNPGVPCEWTMIFEVDSTGGYTPSALPVDWRVMTDTVQIDASTPDAVSCIKGLYDGSKTLVWIYAE